MRHSVLFVATLGGSLWMASWSWRLEAADVPASGPQSEAQAQQASEPAGTLVERTQEALREAEPGRPESVRRLLEAYKSLQQDQSLPRGQRDRLRRQASNRLLKIAAALKRRLPEAPAPSDGRQAPPGADAIAGEPVVNEAAVGDSADRSLEVDAEAEAAAVDAETVSSPGLAGGGSQQDLGQELVELIQRTIAPQSWEAVGGPGVIRYWRPWRVLVVRQTDDVHEQIGGVARGLRP